MDKIYQDENNNFQFDFRNAEEVVVLDKLTHCIPEFHVVNLEEWKRMFPQYIIEFIGV